MEVAYEREGYSRCLKRPKWADLRQRSKEK